MISVVVPTMWKFAPFPDFLASIVDNKFISDVVVINNDRQHTPDRNLWNHDKIKMLDYHTNLYVNPAWNLGVMHSKSDIICLANDDLIFDPRIFKKIADCLQPDHGCYGIQSFCKHTGDIVFEKYEQQPIHGFGQLMFVHKKNWIDIPHGLNIMYGDNFVFDMHKNHQLPNYIVKNLLHYTPCSQTIKLIPTRSDESQIYLSLCKEWNWTTYYPCPVIEYTPPQLWNSNSS